MLLARFGLILFLGLGSLAHAQTHAGGEASLERQAYVDAAPVIPPADKRCYNEIKKRVSKLLVRLSKEAYVYHWFKNADIYKKGVLINRKIPVTDAASREELERDSLFQQAAKDRAVEKAATFWISDKAHWNPGANMVGPGFYVSAGPIDSRDFGGKPDEAVVTRVKLPPGTLILRLPKPDPNDDSVITEFDIKVGPACGEYGFLDPSFPDHLNLYQAALKELHVGAISFQYNSMRYDGGRTSDGNNDSERVAFSLIDPRLVQSSEVQSQRGKFVLSDAPPTAGDSKESLYYKYFQSFEKYKEFLRKEPDGPTKSVAIPQVDPEFAVWARRYIMTMTSFDSFVKRP